MVLRIVVTNPGAKLKQNMAQVQDRFFKAIDAATRMVAGYILEAGRENIKAGGNFGDRWMSGLHVDVDGVVPRMRIAMTHDIPYADIFEEGGTIKGNPLLWIPLSGTDAEGIRPADYGGLVFASKKRPTGKPLAFSIADGLPRYFGTESVTIPKLWTLNDTMQRTAMENFQTAFSDAYEAAE
jgi:hypothetical protein